MTHKTMKSEKPKATKQKPKVQTKAKPKKEKSEKVKISATYIDVLDRIADYIENNGGYNLYIGGKFYGYESSCELEDKVSMQIGDEEYGGDEWLNWNSVKDFLTADFDGEHHANINKNGCVSIFNVVSCWAGNHGKLVSRPSAWLVDNLKKLADVDTTDTSPTALMKELNRLKI